MPTKLTKPVEREVSIPGVDRPVLITIAPGGVTARIKGSKASPLAATWSRLIEGMVTPQDVPSHLYGKPLELLKYKGKK